MKGGNKAKQKLEIPDLKVKFLEYYSKLPNQRLAAGFIGRDEDTIIRWKNDDTAFAEAILKAESAWAEQKAGRVRSAEWLLERVLKRDFSPRSELTGKDGEDLLPKPLLGGISNVPSNNSNK